MALSPALSRMDVSGVRVIDDAFAPGLLDELVRTIAAVPLYYLNHAVTEKTHELYSHWAYPLVIADHRAPHDIEPELQALDDTLMPVKAAWQQARRWLPRGAKPVNAYINGYTYGTDGYPHHETLHERASELRTILFHCCPRWEPAWGGETVFFDRDGDITAAVMPKPGRALVFRGNVLHAARAPSRFCPIERRVLVFKAWTKGIPARQIQPA